MIVKFGDFEYCLVFSLAAVGLVVLFDSQGRVSPLYAVSLFALSLAGFFALQYLGKAGLGSPDSAYFYLVVVIASFLASAFSFYALSTVLPLFFLPLCLAVPAFSSLARFFVSPG